MYVHWSWRSSDSDVELPAHCSSTLRRTSTKPMPGGPSMHLPEAAISASNFVVRASMPIAPNELIASTMRLLPWRSTTAAISGSGLRMPVEVSQWMRPTCVIDASAFSSRSTSAGVVGTSSAVSNVVTLRPIICGELREAQAVRAVDQHQHVAGARDQRVDRRLDRERAAALHRHADVRVAGRG